MKIQTSIIQDTLEIGEKVFPVRINIAKFGDEIIAKRVELLEMARTKELEKAGEALIQLMRICFGDEATDFILEYYERDYSTMILDITPFFTDVIYPALDDARKRAIEATKKMKHG